MISIRIGELWWELWRLRVGFVVDFKCWRVAVVWWAWVDLGHWVSDWVLLVRPGSVLGVVNEFGSVGQSSGM